MDLLVWSNVYSVGTTEIDDQHKELMNFINRLHRAQEEGEASDNINTILDELVEYTVHHFKAEEEMMHQHSYPGIDKHKDIHQSLVTDVSNVLEAYQKGEASIQENIMVFLTDWLKDHILGEDKAFGQYLKRKRAEEEDDDLEL